jgi:asparagine synthase (glutamine-hydrolysing)
MCGLTGFWQRTNFSVEAAQVIAEKMAERIAHRGPDDMGVWVDEAAGVALAQRRLSILDLSPAGHQPMVSASNRYVIAFNGEIYNHLELRGLLRPARNNGVWRGHSDTETLLAGFESWGIEATLKKQSECLRLRFGIVRKEC